MVRSISIDIAGYSSCGTSSPTISHEESDGANKGSLLVRVAVTMPTIVNADAAMMTSALLLDFVENHHEDPDGVAVVERVRISNLAFVDGFAEGLTTFLILHAHTVRSVSLHNITDCDDPTKRTNPGAKAPTTRTQKALAALVQAYQTASQLDTIDLSRNTIGVDVWNAFVPYTAVARKLVLDNVVVDNESIRTLAKANIIRSIEQFHLTLAQPLESNDQEAAANELLQHFSRLRTLRWVYKNEFGTSTEAAAAELPWSSLIRAAKRNYSTLDCLIVGGGHATGNDVNVLSSSLEALPKITTLKLRDIDLDDEGLRKIVAAIIRNRLPLACLDVSHNHIQSEEGSSAVLELLSSPQIIESLKSLSINNNRLDASSLSKIITTVSNLYTGDFQLLCDNNATDTGPVAYEFAVKKKAAETDRDTISRELARAKSQLKEAQYHLREISAAQTTILADYQKLKKENRELKEDRDTLMRAFEILGSMKQVEAQTKLLARVSRIEERIFGEEELLLQQSPTRRALNEFMAATASAAAGDDETRSRSSSYDEGSVSRPGGRRHPVPRSRSNDSVVSMSMERRKRELKRSSMDTVHHGSTTTATTLGSSRSTLFSSSVQSFEDMSNSMSTLALTPSPRRRLTARGTSERWARSPAMVAGSPDRVPKTPSLHLSHHSIRHFGDSIRSLKSTDIVEVNEDEVSLDPDDVIVRTGSPRISR